MNVSEKKKKFEKVAFLSDILNIILVIITIPLTNTLFFIFKNGDFTYLQSIGFNWKTYPITSFSQLNLQRGQCLDVESQILFDFWGGTVKGCDCSGSMFVSGTTLTRGFCSRKQSGCTNIAANPTRPLIFWRSKMFCKNMNLNAKNYFDFLVADSPDNCPSNTKSCGILDSLNNILCIDIKENCPINQLTFFSLTELKSNTDIFLNLNKNSTNSTNSSNSFNGKINYFNSDSILLTNYIGYLDVDGGILAFSNLFTNNRIITQFKISEGQPCLIPFFDNSRSARFILEYNYYQSKCNYRKYNTTVFSNDKRYWIIDTYSKYNLYKQNGILKNFDYFINSTNSKNQIPDFNNNMYVTYPTLRDLASVSSSSVSTNDLLNSNSNSNGKINLTIDNFYVNYIYNYDFNFNYNVDLYARNFIGLKKKCYDEIKAKGLQNAMISHVSFIPIYFAISSNITYYILLAVITLAVYNIVVYGVFYFLKKTVDQPDVVLYFDKFKFKLLFLLFPLLLHVVVIVMIINIRSSVNNDQTPLNYLNNYECVDSETYDNLSDFYSRINDSNKFTFGIAVTIGVSFVNSAGFILLKFLKIIQDE